MNGRKMCEGADRVADWPWTKLFSRLAAIVAGFAVPGVVYFLFAINEHLITAQIEMREIRKDVDANTAERSKGGRFTKMDGDKHDARITKNEHRIDRLEVDVAVIKATNR